MGSGDGQVEGRQVCEGKRARRGKGREPASPSHSGVAGCWRFVGSSHGWRWPGGGRGERCTAWTSGAGRDTNPASRSARDGKLASAPGGAHYRPGTRNREARGVASAGWRLIA